MAHILCVDNDVAAVQLRRSVLERAGHRVEVSTSAGHAVALLKSYSYDAIVMDWRLGGEDARGVILAAKHEAETPVIVLSSFIDEAFQSAGPVADLYLDKPVDPVELIEILEVLLRER